MSSQYEKYRMRDNATPLAERYFNPVWKSIDLRIAALEEVETGISRVLVEIQQYGLTRIQTQIQPMLDQISGNLSQLSSESNTKAAQIADYLDDLTNSTVSGNLTVTGNLSAANLSAATSGQSGLVRTDTTAANPIVYLKASVDSLIAALSTRTTNLEGRATSLETRVSNLETQVEQIMSAQNESIGAYGAEYRTGTTAHTPPSGTPYWAGIVAYSDAVISAYPGVGSFASGFQLRRGESLAIRTTSFTLSSGAVMALKGKPS